MMVEYCWLANRYRRSLPARRIWWGMTSVLPAPTGKKTGEPAKVVAVGEEVRVGVGDAVAVLVAVAVAVAVAVRVALKAAVAVAVGVRVPVGMAVVVLVVVG